MRRTTPHAPIRPPLLVLALALWAAHAVLAAPPARAGFIQTPLPAGSEPVHFADQPPGSSVVGLDPVDGIAVTVTDNASNAPLGDVILGNSDRDAAVYSHATGPEGDLTVVFSRPVYGVAFLFGASWSGADAIGVNDSALFSPTFYVGFIFGTPGGRVSVLATEGDAISSVSVDSGSVGGVYDLRILARPVATPEPAGLALMGVGGVGLVGAWAARRGRRGKRGRATAAI